VAGSYAEMAPVVHIVGTPPTTAQNAGAVLHHSLGDGNFRVFADMYAKVTVAQTNLIDASTAAEMIDAVLRECWLQSRPVYIELPTNMVKAQVEGKRLETPLVLSNPAIDEGFEDMEVDTILDRIYEAERAVIIVDGFAARYRALEELRAFVDRTGLPTFTTSFGKSLIDEHLPNFGGIYTGGATPDKSVKNFVEGADLVLRMGPLDSDVNTTGFSLGFKKEQCIDFFAHNVNIGGEGFKMQHMKSLLEKLTERIDVSQIVLGDMPKRASTLSKVKTMSESDEITHDNMWSLLSAKYVKETDIVIAETGTAAQGVWGMELPSDTQLVNSCIWLSIGYAVGATQGVALAARDMGRKSRTILFEGDGSFQMTAQEVSTMVKHDLDITM
jgi:pyruvate decarboxylase